MTWYIRHVCDMVIDFVTWYIGLAYDMNAGLVYDMVYWTLSHEKLDNWFSLYFVTWTFFVLKLFIF